MGPVVEAPGPDAFLEDTPDNLYERGEVSPVPWISGFVANEGNSLSIGESLNGLLSAHECNALI